MDRDFELKVRDIQELSDSDGIVGLFTKLGYDTNQAVEITTAALGMSAGSVISPIKKIRKIADDGSLGVYLFELQSVTITHTKALSRQFRNKPGNYLLVLTSDYQNIDFVLLERISAEKQTGRTGGKQASIRPRLLTVNRMNPSRVDMRVLRRFKYTEEDGYAQYEKLLSAYTVSE